MNLENYEIAITIKELDSNISATGRTNLKLVRDLNVLHNVSGVDEVFKQLLTELKIDPITFKNK